MTQGHVVIAGLGNTGLSVARHLAARGWRLAGTDTRDTPPGLDALRAIQADMPLRCGGLDATLLDGAACVVASPGLALDGQFFSRARERGIAVIGDIELFARAVNARVVGITGTNGKSTVTTLVTRMAQRAGLAARAGGNLGPPALDLLDGEPADLYVLELSSYQLETTESLRLVAATVLNVTPDHMDRSADLQAYADAKARIFRHCGWAVVNVDDPLVARMPAQGQARLGFSLDATTGADYTIRRHDSVWWLARGAERLLAVDAMRIRGLHNAANALAALALGEAIGLPREAMLAEVREFPGLPHRAEWVADLDGVQYVNDSKGTNVGSTLAAVAGFEGSLIVIAGGDGKNQDFSPLKAAFAGKVRHAVLIGRDAPQLATALDGACTIERAGTLEEAVAAARRVARPGETVLLSPACASLDMFKDYTHRGAVFAAAVKGMAA